MNKETLSYVNYSINEMLINMIPTPIKSKKNGFFSVINKWTRKDGYTIDYVYFVVKSIYEKFVKTRIKFTLGYFENSLKKMVDQFDPEVNKVPYCGSREDLLMAGHTVESLPYSLLTKEERKEKKKLFKVEVDISDDDRDNLSKFLETV